MIPENRKSGRDGANQPGSLAFERVLGGGRRRHVVRLVDVEFRCKPRPLGRVVDIGYDILSKVALQAKGDAGLGADHAAALSLPGLNAVVSRANG